jgi:hypothetical protein
VRVACGCGGIGPSDLHLKPARGAPGHPVGVRRSDHGTPGTGEHVGRAVHVGRHDLPGGRWPAIDCLCRQAAPARRDRRGVGAGGFGADGLRHQHRPADRRSARSHLRGSMLDVPTRWRAVAWHHGDRKTGRSGGQAPKCATSSHRRSSSGSTGTIAAAVARTSVRMDIRCAMPHRADRHEHSPEHARHNARPLRPRSNATASSCCRSRHRHAHRSAHNRILAARSNMLHASSCHARNDAISRS